VTLPTSGTLATTSNKLSDFATTTSAELADTISDETGTGKAVFNTAPTIKQRVTTKTTTATLTVDEAGTVLVSASSDYTITLPTAVGNTGLTYHFKKTDANYNCITLDGDGRETINYENADGVTKENYARLNTYGAEVTLVSDDSNWQAYDEKLGQVPYCRAYTDATPCDNLKEGVYTRIPLSLELADVGNNFDNSEWVSGTADGTVANHLQDDTSSQFTSAMVGYRVKNTTDNTYAWITAYNDVGDITLSADIFVNGEGYEIKQSKFVCPIAGRYEVKGVIGYNNPIAGNRYYVALFKNGSAADMVYVVYHTALGEGLYGYAECIATCSKDDYINLVARAYGGDTADIYVNGNYYTFLEVRLVSKD